MKRVEIKISTFETFEEWLERNSKERNQDSFREWAKSDEKERAEQSLLQLLMPNEAKKLTGKEINKLIDEFLEKIKGTSDNHERSFLESQGVLEGLSTVRKRARTEIVIDRELKEKANEERLRVDPQNKFLNWEIKATDGIPDEEIADECLKYRNNPKRRAISIKHNGEVYLLYLYNSEQNETTDITAPKIRKKIKDRTEQASKADSSRLLKAKVKIYIDDTPNDLKASWGGRINKKDASFDGYKRAMRVHNKLAKKFDVEVQITVVEHENLYANVSRYSPDTPERVRIMLPKLSKFYCETVNNGRQALIFDFSQSINLNEMERKLSSLLAIIDFLGYKDEIKAGVYAENEANDQDTYAFALTLTGEDKPKLQIVKRVYDSIETDPKFELFLNPKKELDEDEFQEILTKKIPTHEAAHKSEGKHYEYKVVAEQTDNGYLVVVLAKQLRQKEVRKSKNEAKAARRRKRSAKK